MSTLQQLVPQTIDDIIRANRDKCRLSLATDPELAGLAGAVKLGAVSHTLTDWNIFYLHVTDCGEVLAVSRLLGAVQDTGQPWLTSMIVSVDLAAGLVQTENSIYRIEGPRIEPDMYLLMHVCLDASARGRGVSGCAGVFLLTLDDNYGSSP